VLGGPPHLFFTCHLRPTDGRLPKARRTYGEDDIQVALVFYSIFEQLDLPCSGPMDKRDVQKYYKLRAHPNTYALRGPSFQCPESRAVDALVSPRQCYTTRANDPILAPKESAQSIPIRPHGHSPGVRQEGKQRVRAQRMALAVWARKASRGGSVCR
jgi:hypothetical protein